MTILKKIRATVCASVMLFAFAGTANAVITLTPSSAGVIAGYGYGPNNCEPSCVTEVFGATNLSLLYKAEAWGSDEGTFASSYTTLFYDTIFDPSDALLFWDGGPTAGCAACYLAIKDGNSSPGYYFYNLSGWNGLESISLSDFWPQRGAISHISIWGGAASSVPEPATLGLFGLGMLFAGFVRRRRSA